MTRWVLPLTMGALLLGSAVFLATRELGAANEYAGVGSFLIAVIGLGLSLWTLRAKVPGDARRPVQAAEAAEPAARRYAGSDYKVRADNSTLVMGTQGTVNVNGPAYRPVKKERSTDAASPECAGEAS